MRVLIRILARFLGRMRRKLARRRRGFMGRDMRGRGCLVRRYWRRLVLGVMRIL
jgi:hypothetical protein